MFASTGAENCNAACNRVLSQGTVTDPAVLVSAPADGTVTEWRVGVSGGPGTFHLRILRPLPGGSFASVGRSEAAVSLNTAFPNPTNLPIHAGDRIGVEVAATDAGAGISRGSGGGYSIWNSLPDGTSSVASGVAAGTLKLNATVELAAPVITGVVDAEGGTVRITGDHFAGATAVGFGSSAATLFDVVSTNQINALPPPGTGTVPVTVTTAGGTGTGSYTYPDSVSPGISLLTLAPARFSAANSGPSLIAATVGTQVIYELSEPATTRFTVQRAHRGRRKGRRCVPTRRAPKGRKCTRYKTVRGSFSHAGSAGLNRFRFMGRLRGRALKPGKYRLVAIATDQAGNRSKPRRRGFKIVR
jgi:hypothetical protein